MPNYENMSARPQPQRWIGVWTLVLAITLFVSAVTLVALYDAGNLKLYNDKDDDRFFLRRIWIHFQSQNEASKEEPATVERIARAAVNESSLLEPHSNNYYEEQRAVVVNAESAAPILAQRQTAFGPPDSRSDSYEQTPDFDADESYAGKRDQLEELYFDQSQESSASTEQESYPAVDEGRAAQNRAYDTYYRQWQYAVNPTNRAIVQQERNRKLHPAAAAQNRAPYPAYEDAYDYPAHGYQPQQVAPKPATPTATASNAVANVDSESTLVTVLKTLKQFWDLYQALASAWNSLHLHHQQSAEQLKKEQMEKQRLRQQQQKESKNRINSKKPPHIEGEKNAQRNQTKKANRTTTTTTTAATTLSSDESASSEEPSAEETNTEKVEARKGAKKEQSARAKRASESTDVGEGRYIKGDPLKGYYDFVITEGSYKFWAAFQVGTALLIIYSTFAAIYYSKVNPLVSDYDYTDYLGGGRSLSGGDDDFVDDSDVATTATAATSKSGVLNWLPRTAHSLKFILDAIDKLPLDNQKAEAGWPTGDKSGAANS